MLPHPAISPFDNRFEQTRIEDGLWTRFVSNANRKHFTSFEYLAGKTRHAKGFIGHKRANSYKDIYLPILTGEDGDDVDLLADAFQGDADFIDGVGTFPAIGDPGFNLFNSRYADYASDVATNGFRLVTGFNDADGSGLMLDFWINLEGTSNFNAARALTARGNVGNPDTAGIAGRGVSEQGFLNEFLNSADGFLVDLEQADVLQVLSRNLLNLAAIPVDDGTLRLLSDGTYLGGTAIPYDLEFRVKNRTESMGAALDFISTRSVRKKFFKANVVMGGRYVYINESFRFDGRDSGLAYDTNDDDELVFSRAKVHSLPNFADDDGNFIVDDAIFIEPVDTTGGGGGGAGSGRALRLDLIAAMAGREHPGTYRAFLEHRMTTHLTGPEVGMNYSLGGKKFRINGLTKVGLMANFERLQLKGNNIGDANSIGDEIDLDLLADPDTADMAGVVDSPLITPTPDNPNPNSFSESYRTTHISPLLEQKIQAEFPVFRYIPMLRRRDRLQNATFTAGWSVIWIGRSRPPQPEAFSGKPIPAKGCSRRSKSIEPTGGL